MRKQRRFTKKQITYGVIASLVAVTIAIWLFAFFGPSPQTAAPAADDTTQEATDTPAEEEAPAEAIPEEVPAATIDPSTVSRIAVEPLELSVAYVKGVPGFGFSVERTASGTRYVAFSSEALIGTKCTDDEGVFASIVVNPSEQDTPTVTETKKLDDTTYGLSLPDDTCTADTTLFTQYQAAFRDAFSLLERLSDDTV